MKRLLLAPLAGSIIFFVWGFVFWTLGMMPGIKPLELEAEVAISSTLNRYLQDDGVYMIPYPPERPDERFSRRHEEGPLGQIYFKKLGAPAMSGKVFVSGWLHMYVMLFAALWFLSLTSIRRFDYQVLFVGALSLWGSWTHELNPVIWWSHPSAFHFSEAFYFLVGILISGAATIALAPKGPALSRAFPKWSQLKGSPGGKNAAARKR